MTGGLRHRPSNRDESMQILLQAGIGDGFWLDIG
jgi:hypothetical protein